MKHCVIKEKESFLMKCVIDYDDEPFEDEIIDERYDYKIIKLYEKYIYDIVKSLKESGKKNYDNFDLSKIFEYYTCIQLTKENRSEYYQYDDIDPDFKEKHNMSSNDTGIDASNLIDTIVQCKLRKNNLTWKECSTFFGSNIVSNNNKLEIKWPKLVLARNTDSKLSSNLSHKKNLFLDKTYSREEMIKYCEQIYLNPPKILDEKQDKIVLRDYQKECISLIKNNKKNIVISLPTGTGKNIIIANSLEKGKKYLILVPRIILMDQLKELMEKMQDYKNKIQIIGDGNNKFNEKYDITICVFNSVSLIKKYDHFYKIFVDEAHHIQVPEIYKDDDDESVNSDSDSDDDSGGDYESDTDDDDDSYSESDSDSDYESDGDSDGDSDFDDESVDFNDEDDSDDDTSYIKTIQELKKYNNNVYLSATIDNEDKNALYYKKDIREMIKLGYLCDYLSHVPIFSEDPTNKNICEYLIKKYRNVIIYSNSQKEGKEFNNLLNGILKGSSEYIDCHTPKAKRNAIIKKYKRGDLLFLVNVRVLVEGFDAPITKCVVFLHLPRSGNTIIQIIGRALRLHNEKTYAHVILPFSTNEDGKNINTFLKTIAKNDSRIRESYETKQLGGYINIENVTEDEKEDNDAELKYEMIYDGLGKLQNYKEISEEKTKILFEFVENNKRTPYPNEEYKNIKIGQWLNNQKQKIKLKNDEIYKTLSKNEIIKNSLDQYLINTEHTSEEKLKVLFEFVEENERNPFQREECGTIRIGAWLNSQKQKIKSKNDEIYKTLSNNKTVKDNLDKYLKNKYQDESDSELDSDSEYEKPKKIIRPKVKIQPDKDSNFEDEPKKVVKSKSVDKSKNTDLDDDCKPVKKKAPRKST